MHFEAFEGIRLQAISGREFEAFSDMPSRPLPKKMKRKSLTRNNFVPVELVGLDGVCAWA